jgi:hypothetical protein
MMLHPEHLPETLRATQAEDASVPRDLPLRADAIATGTDEAEWASVYREAAVLLDSATAAAAATAAALRACVDDRPLATVLDISDAFRYIQMEDEGAAHDAGGMQDLTDAGRDEAGDSGSSTATQP